MPDNKPISTSMYAAKKMFEKNMLRPPTYEDDAHSPITKPSTVRSISVPGIPSNQTFSWDKKRIFVYLLVKQFVEHSNAVVGKDRVRRFLDYYQKNEMFYQEKFMTYVHQYKWNYVNRYGERAAIVRLNEDHRFKLDFRADRRGQMWCENLHNEVEFVSRRNVFPVVERDSSRFRIKGLRLVDMASTPIVARYEIYLYLLIQDAILRPDFLDGVEEYLVLNVWDFLEFYWTNNECKCDDYQTYIYLHQQNLNEGEFYHMNPHNTLHGMYDKEHFKLVQLHAVQYELTGFDSVYSGIQELVENVEAPDFSDKAKEILKRHKEKNRYAQEA